MPSHLYLFAPENDMALAANKGHYTPTAVVTTFAHDVSLLPMWYAQGDEAVVLTQQQVDDKMQSTFDALGITARAVTSSPDDVTICSPWGWSDYMVNKLVRAGVDKAILPDAATIDTLRTLSGRATSRTIMQALADEALGYPMPPLPEVLTTDADVEQYVTSHPLTMLKSPWSSSGRGITIVQGKYDDKTARAAAGTIGKQGYIMGEIMQRKVLDFAMEFYSDGTTVRFAGYSLFNTSVRGVYQGNLLLRDAEIENMLSQHIERSWLHNTRSAMERILTQLIAPHYRGYVGVDMLIYDADYNHFLLHPCIELNLRMSMGMVSRIITDRYIALGRSGTFGVDYFSRTPDLIEWSKSMTEDNPLSILNEKIVKGYLPLTPITNATRYVAYIVVQ